jgi:hypothetical protein
MALDFDQPKENELFIKYIYDDMDRLILRNVYEFDFNNNGPGKKRKYIKPKKLLYQDVYKYRNSQSPDDVRRIYQPIIAPPTGTRNGSTVTFTTTINCRSTIKTSGFIWSGDFQSLMFRAQYPKYNDFRSPNDGTFTQSTKNYTFQNATGQLTHTITTASTVYVKAFCMIETGILFSKTIQL